MQYLLLGFAALLLFLLATRAYTMANPQVLARQLRVGAGVAALAGAGFLVFRGLVGYAISLATLGSWLLWGYGGFPSFPGRAQPSQGQTSRVTTEHLEVELEHDSGDIRGRVLELGDATYIVKFGGARVSQADVLHVVAGNPAATIVADLTNAPHIPSDIFDCIIFTQSLQMIYDMRASLATLHRILKPGGVLLMTSAGIAKIGRRLGRDDWGEYWRLTAASAQALMNESFPGADSTVVTYGNVLCAVAHLHGLATEELEPAELDYVDPDFEVIVAARVRKANAAR